MINPIARCTLSDFQQNTLEHIDRLQTTGKPLVLTVGGKAQLVVQDAAGYQALLEVVDRAEAIIAIRRALDGIARGEAGIPVEECFDALREDVRARSST